MIPQTCPDPVRLKELLEGALPEQEQSELNGHLETCARCQQTLEGLAAGQGSWSELQRQLGPERPAVEASPRPREPAQVERRAAAAETGQAADDDRSLAFLTPSEKPGHLGRLAHYEVTEIIGRGGMGVVLKAFDERLHRVVAIKVMAPDLASNATARKRFVREAQAAAAVRNDHVIDIHAVEDAPSPYPLPQGGEGGRLLYLVMEYISGLSLQERLDESGPLELKEILRIGMQIATGLAAAHAQGLIHRDIKPANILLENSVERVKITDFGLARAADDAGLTQSGVVAGTPQYMSPEQARAEPVDQRSDLFSLGSVLYALCTGRAPFRAGSTVAVLRRVCEDMPRLVREINPDIPDWLTAIIDKLHAKEPADRYQTAAEVAEVLGGRLADLQHPTGVLVATPPVSPPSQGGERKELPPSQGGERRRVAGAEALRSPGQRLPSPLGGRGAGGEGLAGASKTQPRPPTRRRWAIPAAAGLLVVLVAFGLTEATGVTKVTDFVATTLRITTPEGTLIVEVDDPNVKVTIEGDGGLVITGAGPQEVRLKPGSYKLQATKDGKAVKTEVVTITRGGKQVVTISVEPAVEAQPFVILARAGKAEQKFATLTEAVAWARSGDTIEVRGNGPFVSPGIDFRGKALVLRAAPGFRPVIRANADLQPASGVPAAILGDAPLILEGLELQTTGAERWQRGDPIPGILFTGGPLQVANCRFLVNHSGYCIAATAAPTRHLRNCEFIRSGPHFGSVGWIPSADGTMTVDNCVFIDQSWLLHFILNEDPSGASIRLTRNTMVSQGPIQFTWFRLAGTVPTGRIRLESSANVMDGQRWVVQVNPQAEPVEQAQVLLPRVLDWREHQNLYPSATNLLGFNVKEGAPPLELKTLAEWSKFWGLADTGSLRGSVRYQGGDLRTRVTLTPDQLTPQDFRLHAESTGKAAGRDGKDLGADVDLVGPGAAYERWKKTPEYQQWLKDTGQLRAAVDARPFVILARGGKAERSFLTLAGAAAWANSGDTIEIRGDGPFVVAPISLENKALVLRAGTGYRPILQSSSETDEVKYLLTTKARLVLEGLEFHWVATVERNWSSMMVHVAPPAPLFVAHCRIVAEGRTNLLSARADCQVRHCEFLHQANHAVEWTPRRNAKLVVDGCTIAGRGVNLILGQQGAPIEPASIQLTRNSFTQNNVAGGPPFVLARWSAVEPGDRPLALHVADNVFSSQRFMVLADRPEVAELTPAAAEAFVQKLFSYQDQRNLYSPGSELLSYQVTKDGWKWIPLDRPMKDLESWQKFWGHDRIDSLMAPVRFQGGALGDKVNQDPHSLIPADFRLADDSLGKGAGKDGKDLGADLDLVGPGAAYERWKKTPEYQQWLKDTGQLQAAVEVKPFVILARAGKAERGFATLAGAVAWANSGDTIEIRGHGPFVTDRIVLPKHPLVIRAGAGYRPQLVLSQEEGSRFGLMLMGNGPLTLEGLELTGTAPLDPQKGINLVASKGDPVYVTNCRFVVEGSGHALACANSSRVVVRNSEAFSTYWNTINWNAPAKGSLLVENCTLCAHNGGLVLDPRAVGPDARIVIRDTTIASAEALGFHFREAPQVPQQPLLTCELTRTILHAQWSVVRAAAVGDSTVSSDVALDWLQKALTWKDDQPLYSCPGGRYVDFWPQRLANNRLPTLAAWNEFRGLSASNALEGVCKFEGGDVVGRSRSSPQGLGASDFRLLKESPGKGAGQDGKDLGADVDLVGPGAAYERWQQTPEYQQWLKDTGQK